MQLSNYIFISKTIHNDKYNIIYSTITSKSYLISSDVCSKIFKNDLISINSNTLEFLKSERILIKSKQDEFQEFKKSIYDNLIYRDSLYAVILPTSSCQFNCEYCGQLHNDVSISLDAANRVIDRITKKLTDNHFKHLSIGWFGGEPLLALNEIDRMTQSIQKVTKQFNVSYSASIVTNGLNLCMSTFETLVKLCVTKFEITLDGDCETHNRRRNINTKENVFNIIVDNLNKIVHSDIFREKNIKVIIRCNIDKSNKFSWKGLLNKLEELDIIHKLASFYLAPIHSWGNDAHKSAIDVYEFADIELEFLSTLVSKKCKFNILESSKKRTCMAVSTHDEVFDVFGNIYNCTEIPLVDKYKNSNYIVNQDSNGKRKFDNWYSLLFDSKCKKCKILPLCMGVCPKQSEEGTVVCPSIKYNIQEIILLHYYQNKQQT